MISFKKHRCSMELFVPDMIYIGDADALRGYRLELKKMQHGCLTSEPAITSICEVFV